jgi:hypothetical protein
MWDTQNMLEIKKISIQFPLILEHVALSQGKGNVVKNCNCFFLGEWVHIILNKKIFLF